MKYKLLLLVFGLQIFGCKNENPPVKNVVNNWLATEAAAKNTTVRLSMWQGDPLINKFMQDFVVLEIKKRFGITLEIAGGQGSELLKVVHYEKESGKKNSAHDLVWINGEIFSRLREIGALEGPFVQNLPNAKLLNLESRFIGIDFQQKIDGFECPWGNVQLALIYDTIRTPQPPRTLAAFEAYVQNHPKKVTIPSEFTGMTLLKSWLIALAAQSNESLDGPFEEAKYQRFSGQLFDFINRMKPSFWRNGKTYPESLAQMHQLFATGELDFTMSNNDSEVDNKISQRVLPPTSRSFVFESGTIQNSHYLGIIRGTTNLAGCLLVTNFLISPEAQFMKLNPLVWGDGTVLDLAKLPADTRSIFENLPERKNAARRSEIEKYALQEPAPEYMIRLYEDFKTRVMEQK